MDSPTAGDRTEILDRLSLIEERISVAAEAVGRTRDEIRLLLATKTVPAERIRVALKAGYTLIGENRAQELTGKAEDLADIPHESHFIGHLQSNKVNQVLAHADLIQSVDRRSIAQALLKRVEADRVLSVFIQVNTSGEDSKYGVSPDEAGPLACEVDEMDGLAVKGFMTIGLFSDDEVSVRRCYERLRELRDKVVDGGLVGADELSMGMSGDLEWAVAEGSTMLRIGTAVFGKRPTSDSFYWPGSTGAL